MPDQDGPGGAGTTGWDAIERAVAALHPDVEPLHWGTGATLPGAGVYGLSAYRAADHWLFVTFGLTELFDKSSADQRVSGWGFELTMRTPADGAQAAPMWPLRVLQSMGNYVYGTNRPFAPGDRADPAKPLTGADDTELTAVAFAVDPQLGPLETPNGRVEFRTVVGVTADELAQMKPDRTHVVLDQMRRHNPLLMTDPTRAPRTT